MTKKNIPVKLNETYEVPIRDLGIHGEGIGSVNDFTVFVPGALPGETVKATVQTAKKSYAQGRLISIEKASPDRTEPTCPAYKSCGGCQISHLTYEGQLSIKERRVRDVMKRIGGYDEDIVLPILGASHPWNYRNKMAVPVSQVTSGPVTGYFRSSPSTDALSRRRKITGSSALRKVSWSVTISRDTMKNREKAPSVTSWAV